MEKPAIHRLGRVRRLRIQSDAIAGWISKDRGPPVRTLSFRRQRFRAQRFRVSQRGVDIVGRDVHQHLANPGSRHLSHLDKRAARTALRLEHVIVQSWIGLNLPIKQLCVELAGCGWIGCWDFYMANWWI